MVGCQRSWTSARNLGRPGTAIGRNRTRMRPGRVVWRLVPRQTSHVEDPCLPDDVRHPCVALRFERATFRPHPPAQWSPPRLGAPASTVWLRTQEHLLPALRRPPGQPRVSGPFHFCRKPAMASRAVRLGGPPSLQLFHRETTEEAILMKAIVVTDQAAGTAGMTLVDRPEPQA